jgi:hypothetical protein
MGENKINKMKAIDKFILHVVHSTFPLNEYSEGEIRRLIQYFKDEADDLNIRVSEDELRSYIERFEDVKKSLTDKEIRNYSLSKIIQLTTASKTGVKSKKEEAQLTPDVVYHNEDNSIIIYNGVKEENCIKYGAGEKWCITRGAFSNYRYSEVRDYPTFYLAKNLNLPNTNPLSFVAIQVKNDPLRYVWTNRENSPYESDEMNFNELTNEIPWLKNIPNLQNIIKYIPLSSKEKITQQYKNKAVTIKEWEKFPYDVKEQYLTVRSSKDPLFEDITELDFIRKYLPKYPDISNYVAVTPGLFKSETLLSNLEYFNNQNRRSITANIHKLIDQSYLKTSTFPFDVKKLLVKLNKFNVKEDEKLFISKDGSAIIKLTYDPSKSIKLDIYREDDSYTDVSLNKRTEKYLKELTVDDISQIPFNLVLELISKEIFEEDLVKKIIENAKTSKNSPIIIRKEILIDLNTFSAYNLDTTTGKTKISKINFTNNDDIKQIIDEESKNESFQISTINLIKKIFRVDTGQIALLNKLSVLGSSKVVEIINNASYDNRKLTVERHLDTLLILFATPDNKIFLLPSVKVDNLFRYVLPGIDDFRFISSSYGPDDFYSDAGIVKWKIYFEYLRNASIAYTDEDIKSLLTKGWTQSIPAKKAFIKANPPLQPDNALVPYVPEDGEIYLININSPANSFRISDKSNRMLNYKATPAIIRQLTQQSRTQDAIAALAGQDTPNDVPVVRRGRPAGGANTPRPAPQGDINIVNEMIGSGLLTGFNTLPASIRRNLTVGTQVPVIGNRGAARRINLLGNRGRVRRVIESGPSSLYFIQLASGARIVSIAVQPGNLHYVVTADTSFALASPSNLVDALQQRDLTESMKGVITSIYLSENPHRIAETKIILEHYLALKNSNQTTMKQSELKRLITSVIVEVLMEDKKKVKNNKLKKESKSTKLIDKIVKRYNALTESKKRIFNKFTNLK